MASAYDQHYRQGGFGYEAKRDFWRDWVVRHYLGTFDVRRGESLLDVGCGDGFWSSLFHEAGLRTTGFDVSPGGIETARAKYPGPEFVVGNVEGDDVLPGEAFDVVFARNLSHFLRDIEGEATNRATARMMRWVRPGGLLLISQYSKRTGEEANGTVSYRASDIARVLEAHGELWRFELADSHLLFGVIQRGGARRG